MKIENLIKAAFYSDPKGFGFDESYPFTKKEIWKKYIKPNIIEIEYTKKIDNSSIPDYLPGYKEQLMEYVEECYYLCK